MVFKANISMNIHISIRIHISISFSISMSVINSVRIFFKIMSICIVLKGNARAVPSPSLPLCCFVAGGGCAPWGPHPPPQQTSVLLFLSLGFCMIFMILLRGGVRQRYPKGIFTPWGNKYQMAPLNRNTQKGFCLVVVGIDCVFVAVAVFVLLLLLLLSLLLLLLLLLSLFVVYVIFAFVVDVVGVAAAMFVAL